MSRGSSEESKFLPLSLQYNHVTIELDYPRFLVVCLSDDLLFDRFEDKEVQKDMKLVPYKIVNRDGKPYIQVKVQEGETKVFSPEEISAMILTKMKETAETFLGKKIKDAVVTVPG